VPPCRNIPVAAFYRLRPPPQGSGHAIFEITSMQAAGTGAISRPQAAPFDLAFLAEQHS
jgi:hypothetical protein